MTVTHSHTVAAGAGEGPWRSVGAGCAIGITLSLRLISLAALVFAGALSVGVVPGTAAFLVVSILALGIGVVTRFAPSLAFLIAQSPPVAVLLPTIFTIAGTVATGADATTALATTFAVLALTGLLVGLTMAVIAAFDLAWLARLMPATVLAGYFSGTAVLLILSTAASLAGRDLLDWSLPAPGAAELWRIGLTLAFALAAILAYRRFSGLGTIAVVALSVAGFYLAGTGLGLSPDALRDLGLLPQQSGGSGTFDWGATLALWGPGLIGSVDWVLVGLALPAIISAAVVAVLGSLLDFSGVELVARSEIEADGFLRSLAATNIVGGMFGVPATYLSTSSTVLAHELGGQGRLVPISAIATLLAVLLALPQVLTAMPVFVTAGLMVQLAWITLDRWVIRSHLRGGLWDKALVLGIIAVALIFGMAPAVALGFVAASLIFAFTYAQLPVVRRAATLADMRSAVDRGGAQTRHLDREGHRVAIAVVEGFLFFGSVTRLLGHARHVLAADPKPDRLILDFSRVKGVDATALEALRKLDFIAGKAGTAVVVAACAPDLFDRLEGSGLFAQGTAFDHSATLDAALEAAEEALLSDAGASSVAPGSGGALSALTGLVRDAARASDLLALMDRRDLAPGETLIEAGAEGREVFLVDEGRVAVLAQRPDGSRFRVRSMRAGAFVGEIASYAGLPRTADVVAEAPSVVYVMAPGTLDAVARRDPALAAAWHEVMAAALAEKLNRTTLALRDAT